MDPDDFNAFSIKYPISPVVLPDFDMHGFSFPFSGTPTPRGDVKTAVWLSSPGLRSFQASPGVRGFQTSPGVRGWLAEPND